MVYKINLATGECIHSQTKERLIDEIVLWLCANERTPNEWVGGVNMNSIGGHWNSWGSHGNVESRIPYSRDINVTGNDTRNEIVGQDIQGFIYGLFVRPVMYVDDEWRHIDIRNLYPEVKDRYHAYKAGLIKIEPIRKNRKKRMGRKRRGCGGYRNIGYKNRLTQSSIPEYREYNKPIPPHIRSPWWDDYIRSYSGDWKSNTKNPKQWAKHKRWGSNRTKEEDIQDCWSLFEEDAEFSDPPLK